MFDRLIRDDVRGIHYAVSIFCATTFFGFL